jgi:hypothetical protein
VATSVAVLTQARDGFERLGARWEEAVSALWLAEALKVAASAGEARASAESAAAVFDELRSVRELEHARSVLAGL